MQKAWGGAPCGPSGGLVLSQFGCLVGRVCGYGGISASVGSASTYRAKGAEFGPWWDAEGWIWPTAG